MQIQPLYSEITIPPGPAVLCSREDWDRLVKLAKQAEPDIFIMPNCPTGYAVEVTN